MKKDVSEIIKNLSTEDQKLLSSWGGGNIPWETTKEALNAIDATKKAINTIKTHGEKPSIIKLTLEQLMLDGCVTLEENEISNFMDIYSEFKDWINNGQIKENGVNVLGYSVFSLTHSCPQHKFSVLGAFRVLCSLKKFGKESPLYKALKLDELVHLPPEKLIDTYFKNKDEKSQLSDIEYIEKCIEDAKHQGEIK